MHGNPLKCVFMGTPEFAVEPLKELLSSDFVEVTLVVTRPDAVSGRGKALVPSPVAACAEQAGVEVLKTKTLRDDAVKARLSQAGADVFCLAAYGAIVPTDVLAMPRLGCLNVHASVLPRGRGAAPMQRALLDGGEPLGYSIMRIEEGLDTGAYCVQGTYDPGERCYDEVAREISILGGKALADVLEGLARGCDPVWTVQNEALATHAPKIEKSEVLLDPAFEAAQNMKRVQASGEAAPARCVVDGRPSRICSAHVLSEPELADLDAACDSGEVVVWRKRLLLGCSSGVLEVLEIKPDGKRQMAASEFAASVKGKRGVWEAL